MAIFLGLRTGDLRPFRSSRDRFWGTMVNRLMGLRTRGLLDALRDRKKLKMVVDNTVFGGDWISVDGQVSKFIQFFNHKGVT